MTDTLEQGLREMFASRAAGLQASPRLAAAARARGRRQQQTRRALVVACAVAAVVVGSSVLLRPPAGRTVVVTTGPIEAPTGAPAVPVVVGDPPEQVLDQVDGEPRARDATGLDPVAAVPAGVLVLTGSPASLAVLRDDGAGQVTLLEGLGEGSVAVSADGSRVAGVVGVGPRAQVREVDVVSARVLRSLDLAGPLGGGVPPRAVAYSGGAVLLERRSGGGQQQVLLWEQGEGGVLSPLDGVTGVLGGAEADLDPGAVGGRAAFEVAGGRCAVEVRELSDGDGDPWSLCGETFVAFSPDGRLVLSLDEEDGRHGVVVRTAADGTEVSRTELAGPSAASSWETPTTTLHTVQQQAGPALLRCPVAGGPCGEVPDVDATRGLRALPRSGASTAGG